MNKKTESHKERPDEPKPQRPMQPVFEPGPEPDPRTRAMRPEESSQVARDEKLREQEEEEFNQRNEKRKAANKAALGN
jgi:hypothetical protein